MTPDSTPREGIPSTAPVIVNHLRDAVDGEDAWPLLAAAKGRVGTIDILELQDRRRTPGAVAQRLAAHGPIWAAVVESPRQTPTRLTAYHGLWGYSPLGRSAEGADDWSLSDGRSAGVAPVPTELVAAMVGYAARHHGTALLLASGGARPELSATTLDAAYDRESDRLDWGELVAQADGANWLPARAVDDEFAFSIEVFGASERIAAVAERLAATT